ncbi:MAG: ribonuclease E/G [Chakrabartia sp.]
MTRTLVWDPAPGETRCLLLEDGVPVEIHLLRDLDGDAMARPGSVHTARLVARLGNGRGLALLESGEEVLVRPVPPGPEGSALHLRITRPRLPEPGQWKRALATPVTEEDPPAPDNLHAALWAKADLLLCARAGDAPADLPIPVRVDADAVADADLDGLLDQARTGLIPFDGGRLSIERTRAMTIIDVDGGGDPQTLNLAAAAAVGRALRLFQIGGPVGIDFVSMASRADRQAVDAALAKACAPLGPLERTAINGFGFAQIVRPRTGPSLPELLCGTTPGQLSAEAQALALLRAAMRATGVGPRTLTARPSVVDLLQRWTGALDAVRRATGADVKLVSDPALSGYGHVHVTPA